MTMWKIDVRGPSEEGREAGVNWPAASPGPATGAYLVVQAETREQALALAGDLVDSYYELDTGSCRPNGRARWRVAV